MFTVCNETTAKVVEVNFEQLKTLVGEELDEVFYTSVFTNHRLTGTNGMLVVMEGAHD